MRRPGAVLVVLLAPVLLGGCLAQAALDVATAPVRVAAKAVDLATTSQSESDEQRGRELRRREERLGQLEREYGRYAGRCAKGDGDSCRRAELARAEIADILPTVPVGRRH